MIGVIKCMISKPQLSECSISFLFNCPHITLSIVLQGLPTQSTNSVWALVKCAGDQQLTGFRRKYMTWRRKPTMSNRKRLWTVFRRSTDVSPPPSFIRGRYSANSQPMRSNMVMGVSGPDPDKLTEGSFTVRFWA